MLEAIQIGFKHDFFDHVTRIQRFKKSLGAVQMWENHRCKLSFLPMNPYFQIGPRNLEGVKRLGQEGNLGLRMPFGGVLMLAGMSLSSMV